MTNKQLVRCECGLMHSVAHCACGAWFVVRSRKDRQCAACAERAEPSKQQKKKRESPPGGLRCDTCGSPLFHAPNPGEPFRTDEPRSR